MKINYRESYRKKIEAQLEYISGDKPKAAKKFNREVKSRINKLPKNPYMCRKSIYFDDENIRDLIIDGYTIVYKILKDEIDVFGFIKYEETLKIDPNN
jgi:plasmid stabilization system protein ParE